MVYSLLRVFGVTQLTEQPKARATKHEHFSIIPVSFLKSPNF